MQKLEPHSTDVSLNVIVAHKRNGQSGLGSRKVLGLIQRYVAFLIL
jgi:hypothetical protein